MATSEGVGLDKMAETLGTKEKDLASSVENLDGDSVKKMFELQLEMNRFSRISQLSTSVAAELNGSMLANIRNMKQ
jgi:hypothetical protein